MRALKSGLTVVLWASMAMAQTPTSGPGTSTAPNQTPVSPLEEPKKPSEAEQNAPQAAKFDIGDRGASNEDQQLGELRLTTRWTEVGGDHTRSFRVSQH